MLVSRRVAARRIWMCSTPRRKSTPSARVHPKPDRRRTKYPAAHAKDTAATTHHKAGRQAYTPTTMPEEQAKAARSMGWRGAFVGKTGGAAALGIASIDQELCWTAGECGMPGRSLALQETSLIAPDEPRFPSGKSAETSPPTVFAPRDSLRPAGAPDPWLAWPDRMKHK
jgi:hypothetical protein